MGMYSLPSDVACHFLMTEYVLVVPILICSLFYFSFLWLLLQPERCMGHCRNSEIYNHEELKQRYLKGVKIVKDSKSDSAIIGHMYEVRTSE